MRFETKPRLGFANESIDNKIKNQLGLGPRNEELIKNKVKNQARIKDWA